ncbi:MAG: hypothetical protein LUQ65_02185, partial [Candidatus Helarchaeota archaeon]|nr:hypothetical protein [Candidatus Helarchaeota archaeon]
MRFDLNMIPQEHTVKMKGNGSIDYKIVVNYDWDFDEIDDVEEIQKKWNFGALDPTIPNVWGFFEKRPDIFSTINTTGLASGYFNLFIPESYNEERYLYISAESGELSGITVDDDNLTLNDVTISGNNQSYFPRETPYGILTPGYHLICFEYAANTTAQISFFVDNKEVIVFEKAELRDSDGDGVKDEEEDRSGRNKYNSDSDQDGLPDNLDSSPIASLSVNKDHITQIVLPHNKSRNTIITMSIKKPTPDYTSTSSRIFHPQYYYGHDQYTSPYDQGGLEILIQPALRLYGNQSITRSDLCTFWKEDASAYDSFCLVDGYDASSVGDAIPDRSDPNAETTFIMPKAALETYEFVIYIPKGHLAKLDNVIDLRFDFIWLITYYNATKAVKLLHYYPFDQDPLIQSLKVQEIGNVSYILGSPDSLVENQILWALTQNPQLGPFNEFGVADDIVGSGMVDFFGLVNKTLTDRNDHPRANTDTEVLYFATHANTYDVLNKINTKIFGESSFAFVYAGDLEYYFSSYSITNVYKAGLYTADDPEVSGEDKTCYYVGWCNYTEDGIANYEQRATLMGFPIEMSLLNFQNARVLKITEALGFEIPLTDIPFSLEMNLHDRIVFLNQTYVELKEAPTGIPLLNFNNTKHSYTSIIDNRRWSVEESELIFSDYGYPISKSIVNSFNELKEISLSFYDLLKGLPQLSQYTNFDFNEMWGPNSAVISITLWESYFTLINDLPNLILTQNQNPSKFDVLLSAILSPRNSVMDKVNAVKAFLPLEEFTLINSITKSGDYFLRDKTKLDFKWLYSKKDGLKLKFESKFMGNCKKAMSAYSL